MKKTLILSTFLIVIGFNLQVNADRVARGLFGGAAGGALLGGLAGGGKGAAIGAGVGAGVGLIAGSAAEKRARERRYYRSQARYQAPPAYVDYGDEDVVYVPVRRQRYAPQSYPRAQRRVAVPQTQRIVYGN
jgi:predicted lipid-binding transport protein (Tim44 family)